MVKNSAPRLFQFYHDCPFGNVHAFLHKDVFYGAFDCRFDEVFHFHGFQNEERRADSDPTALLYE